MEQALFSPNECYWQYLERQRVTLNSDTRAHIAKLLNATNWDDPQSAIDRNHVAIVALIEAEQCDPAIRGFYLETAFDALNASANEHLLCAAHLAIAHSLIGNAEIALEVAFSAFIHTLDFAHSDLAIGLVYLPNQLSDAIVNAENGAIQARLLLSEVLQRSQDIFYNSQGVRFLQLSAQVLPQNFLTHLKLGIAQLLSGQWEGLFALHRSHALAPAHLLTLQALFLAYRNLGQPQTADFWLNGARKLDSETLYSKWTTLTPEDAFTYVAIDNCLLAVEASFRSIVTAVLIAEGDWFEREMEFWRNQIQPGMTVIDVGANVGVYTVSAAQQVGTSGRVIAIEPFSGCVQCLEETRRVNNFSQIQICHGAVSDRIGTAKLTVQPSSELNELIVDSEESIENFEEVRMLTLDSLIESENLDRLDFLKIDAEGHELQVLQGSDRILTQYKPVILYENIAGSKGSNLPVAQHLTANGYQLFRYQPYVAGLIAIESIEALQDNLNVIALPIS